MGNFLNLSLIVTGNNLNYGDSVGNIMQIKKLSYNGNVYTYISRQALRYDINMIVNNILKTELAPVRVNKKVVQFSPEGKIDQFPEIDLFGYMKTAEKKKKKADTTDNADSEDAEEQKTRSAVVRVTDAISLEPYRNDIDFGNNMGLASRPHEGEPGNNLFQTEIHKSLYVYTVTADLDKIGVDKNESGITIQGAEKARRVCALLDALKLLYREVKARTVNLTPVFVIGGLSNFGNPFFYDRLAVEFRKEGLLLNTNTINEILSMTIIDGSKVADHSTIGSLAGMFRNLDEIKIEKEKKKSIEGFFADLKKEVNGKYGITT
ncbi:MAG: type I-B CRISPR-associated protein Cas7/Cst2/DevR [Smithella sp.]|nr:type I-B CRISPR-associated protein Cas7/Cst2/DevR [Smithella sp.]